jgi:hypothetical protein
METVRFLRRTLLQRAAHFLARKQFATPEELRRHINEEFTTFTLAPLTDEEFCFLLTVMKSAENETTSA